VELCRQSEQQHEGKKKFFELGTNWKAVKKLWWAAFVDVVVSPFADLSEENANLEIVFMTWILFPKHFQDFSQVRLELIRKTTKTNRPTLRKI
jgi:hypothetical protein